MDYMQGLTLVGGLVLGGLLILMYSYLRRFKSVTEKVTNMIIYNKVVEITLVLDTAAYSQNDILCATAEVVGALPTNAKASLESIVLRDAAKQNAALQILLLKSDTSVGAANAAENMADSVGAQIVAVVPIEANDYISMSNFSMVSMTAAAGDTGMGAMLHGKSDRDDRWAPLYIAAKITDASSKTYAADSITIQLGLTITSGR